MDNTSDKMKKIHINKNGNRKLLFSKSDIYVVVLDNVSGEFKFEITAENVDLKIFGIYKGIKNNVYSIKTIQHHKAPNSRSDLLIKGVFDDESTFNYHGLVRIDKNCNGSHAYQKNQNLLLSSRAKVTSEPDLEILSPDVFCTHGSTTGGVNKDSIYYMQSRGISQVEAKKAYVTGFLSNVLEILES